mmetsp:Transcript_42009/g.116976  ORF Transcript_42009/g.116976 Transcript_42009/m.116976 type:complete len:204 (+) Transcript_42009:136-747(+)
MPTSAVPCSMYAFSKNSDRYWPALPTTEARRSMPPITGPMAHPMLGREPSFHSCQGAVCWLTAAATRSTRRYWMPTRRSARTSPRGIVFSNGESIIATQVEMQSHPSRFQKRAFTNLLKLMLRPLGRCIQTFGCSCSDPHATNANTGTEEVTAKPIKTAGTEAAEMKVGKLRSRVTSTRQSHTSEAPASWPVIWSTVSQMSTG